MTEGEISADGTVQYILSAQFSEIERCSLQCLRGIKTIQWN
jgi:hypothetical protein